MELATELVREIHLEKALTSRHQALLQEIFRKVVKSDSECEKARIVTQEASQAVSEKLAKEIGSKEFVSRVTRLYAEEFSEAELRQFVDFYRSSAGQKIVDGNSDFNRKKVLLGEEWNRQPDPEMDALVQVYGTRLGEAEAECKLSGTKSNPHE